MDERIAALVLLFFKLWSFSFSIVSHFFCSPLICRRFMLNDTLFRELVEASRDLPGNRWAVGGNAPVMAGRMATEGCDVLLGGSFSPDFTDVLSQHIMGIYTQAHTGTPCPPLGSNNLLIFTSHNLFLHPWIPLYPLFHFLCPLCFLSIFSAFASSHPRLSTSYECFCSGR